jgi:hypothetical protein
MTQAERQAEAETEFERMLAAQAAWERALFDQMEEGATYLRAGFDEIYAAACERWDEDYAVDHLEGFVRSRLEEYLATCPREPVRKPDKTPIPHALRRQVLERDAYRCQHCGGWENLAVDHITPESKGGAATLENLQALCRSCNSKKGVRT